MSGPSPHLSWSELGCRDGTPYPREWRATRALPLAAEFEAIRAIVGGPVMVLSAYRTAAHNRLVGGARHSQHVEGRALDLVTLDVVALVAVVRLRLAQPGCKIRGLGIYGTFVHVDIRPTERLVVWHGSRAAADEAA